ncbi:MAG: thioredoxin domain-containing protein [Bacteroidetes bacterium]|nr:MAG: thioredoxin domain-containing protein [Bacteroidota bacterium]
MVRLCTHALWYSLLLSSWVSCTLSQRGTTENERLNYFTNQLIEARSPYLQRHAHQAINWHLWEEESFLLAQQQPKPLLINLGRSACQPCHNMADEVFADTTVANFLNEHFFLMLVDVDERPDLLQLYRNACMLLSRSDCSLPLQIMAMPDGRPVFASTYPGKLQWQQRLEQFLNWYDPESAEIQRLAGSLQQNLEYVSLFEPNTSYTTFSKSDIDLIYEQLHSNLLFSQATPERTHLFANPQIYRILLRYQYLHPDSAAREEVSSYLKGLVWSYSYDHIGGGFFHLSAHTEPPVNFGKFLHENAQLISLYAEAYSYTHEPLFEQVVYESLDFVERELCARNGGCFSSLDPASEGEEGRYYLWSRDEIEELLGRDAAIFMAYYNIDDSGNWRPGQNVLYRSKEEEAFAQDFGMDIFSLRAKIEACKKTVFTARKFRARPVRDEKQITAWNAQVMLAFLDAYQVFEEEKWLQLAALHARHLWENSRNTGRLHRIFYNGMAYEYAQLEDYAFLISAYAELFQHSLDVGWLDKAQTLLQECLDQFYEPVSGMFYMTSSQQQTLSLRQMDFKDGFFPSSNAVMCRNLYKMGTLLGKNEYKRMALAMLRNISPIVMDQPNYYAGWALAMMEAEFAPPTVVVLGPEARSYKQSFMRQFPLQFYLIGCEKSCEPPLVRRKFIRGSTAIYLYKNNYRYGPFTRLEDAMEKLSSWLQPFPR